MHVRRRRALVGALLASLASCSDGAEERTAAVPESAVSVAMFGEDADSGTGASSSSGQDGSRVLFCVPIARAGGIVDEIDDPHRKLIQPGVVVVACSDDERNHFVRLRLGLSGRAEGALADGQTLRLRVIPPCSEAEQLAIIAGDGELVRVLEGEEDGANASSQLLLDTVTTECTWEAGTRLPITLEIQSHCLPAGKRDASSSLSLSEQAHRSGGLEELRGGRGRAPREVWLELEQLDAQGAVVGRDVALCTLAPFTFRCELDPPQRIYATLIPDAKENGLEKRGNFGFLMELLQIAENAGVTEATLWTTHPVKPDQWAQDGHFFGYGTGPQGAQYPYVLRTFRKSQDGTLSTQKSSLTEGRYYKFRSPISGTDSSQDYGGNFLVSPPILSRTEAIVGGLEGSNVKAHPEAPYGKIIFGEARPNMSHPIGGPSNTTRGFLEDQLIQPLLSVELSSLSVGHVDEIISFIPAPSDGVGRWKMLFASTGLAHKLLRAVEHKLGRSVDADAVKIIREAWTADNHYEVGFYKIDELLRGFGLSSVPSESQTTQNLMDFPFAYDRLLRIRRRLIAGLSLGDKDVIDIPVLFNRGAQRIVALLPNMVNLQVLDKTLIVPKSWGPRVSIEVAKDVLVSEGGLARDTLNEIHFDTLTKEALWMSPEQISTLREILEKSESGGKPLPVTLMETSASTLIIPPSLRVSVDHHEETSDNVRQNRWYRVELTWTDSIPLFEAYLLAKLEPLGVTLRFIDDWRHYHCRGGEVHCGTNVSRGIPIVPDAEVWWLNYGKFLR